MSLSSGGDLDLRNEQRWDGRKELRQLMTVASAGSLSSIGRARPIWVNYSAHDLTYPAAFTLNNIPSARSAVLNFIGLLVHESVHLHLLEVDNPSLAGNVDSGHIGEAIDSFSDLLNRKLVEKPEIWRLLLLKWSTQLLSQISLRNKGRRSTASLSTPNETLQLFISCPASRVVADLMKKSLELMMEKDTNQCLSSLLESTNFGAHFDWVLSYIGSCFPRNFVHHVLRVGVGELGEYLQGREVKGRTLSEANALQQAYERKFASFAALLHHIAHQRQPELQLQFRQILIESVGGVKRGESEGVRGILFVLKVILNSVQMAKLLLPHSPDLLTQENAEIVVGALQKVPLGLVAEGGAGEELVERTVQALDPATFTPIFHPIAKLAFPSQIFDSSVSQKASPISAFFITVLEKIASNLGLLVQSQTAFAPGEVPLIDLIATSCFDHAALLNSPNKAEASFYFRLFSLVLIAKGSNLSVQFLNFLLSSHPQNGAAFLSMAESLLVYFPELFEELFKAPCQLLAAQKALLGKKFPADAKTNWVRNICAIIEWEDTGKIPLTNESGVREMIHRHYNGVADLIVSEYEKEPGLCLEGLRALRLPLHLLPNQAYALTRKIAQFLIHVVSICTVDGEEEALKIYWNLCDFALDFIFSQNSFAKELFLQIIVETCLQRGDVLFESSTNSPSPAKEKIALLEENRVFFENKMKASSMIHSGVLRKDRKKIGARVNTENGLFRKELIFRVLDLYCQDRTSPPDQVRYNAWHCQKLAILLNEHLCKDAIGSLHSWESWDVAKLAVDRFVGISKGVAENPISWDLLFLVAEGYPASWYSIPLLKSLLGGLLVQCESSVRKSGTLSVSEREGLDLWFAVCLKGGLLPHSILPLVQVCAEATIAENIALLTALWSYFEERTPDIPTLHFHFERVIKGLDDPDDIPGDTAQLRAIARLIIQKNIAKLGFLFHKFTHDLS